MPHVKRGQKHILSPANLLEGFGVSADFVSQLLIILVVYFNEVQSAWLMVTVGESTRPTSLII